MGKVIELTGQRFGRLLVVSRAPNRGGKTRWYCKCDCGEMTIVNSRDLRMGATKSCGCLNREVHKKYPEGKRNTRLYGIWKGMNRRCASPREKSYRNYGGRGITVCDSWKNNFLAFEEWALENGYSDTLTLDRIDVNGDYCPENCRWLSRKMQNRNTRKTHYLTYEGVTKPIIDWAEAYHVPYGTLIARLGMGWTVKDALTKPVRIKK